MNTVSLTSLSGQYRRPHPSPDVVAAEHLIMAKGSILGEWVERQTAIGNGGGKRGMRAAEIYAHFLGDDSMLWKYELPVLERKMM